MTFEILYEDSDVVVINKPAGVLVHPDGVAKEKTVSDWMGETYPESKFVGEDSTLKNGEVITRPGVVHRLDRDTSGVLVLAKTQDAHAHLKEQFQNRTVAKEYIAITYGVPKEKRGEISAPIGRSAKNFKLWSSQRGARGQLRDALTLYEVIGERGEYGIMRLVPKTGRTHQLRVHMKHINHPIVCDPLYAPKRDCPKEIGRLGLHAEKLTFSLMNRERKTVVAEMPEVFLKFSS